MVENKKIHTPLLAVVKRNDLPTYKAILIRILTFVVTFFLSMLICFFVIKENYFEIIGTLFEGATFVAKNKILPWNLIKETALLLAFAIAIIPAFKMKYWNKKHKAFLNEKEIKDSELGKEYDKIIEMLV